MSDHTAPRPTDDIRADELRALAAAATPGPWCIDESPGFGYHVRTGGTANAIPSTGLPIADMATDEDAAFVVAAVNALPVLLDRLYLPPSPDRHTMVPVAEGLCDSPSPQAKPATCPHGRTKAHDVYYEFGDGSSSVGCPGPQSTEETQP